MKRDGSVERRYASILRSCCGRTPIVSSASGAGHSTLETTNRLAHEYGPKPHLDAAWALRPVKLVREHGWAALFVEYTRGAPLDRLVRQPMETGRFLRLAAAMATALG